MLMLSLIQTKNSKCVTLESPKKLYDRLLILTDENFGHKEKDVFEFSFRNVLPCAVLETHKPLKWFQCLEQRGKLSWMDISSLLDFFEEASIHDLVYLAKHYQARIKVIRFLQRHLQVKLPEICLDDKLNEKWSFEQGLPKHYLKRCHELFRGTQNIDESVNRIRCLFSKGVILLANSCSTPTGDGEQLACLKLLYMANQFYTRFKDIIIADKELLNIKPLPSGKFLAYDDRRRTSIQRRRSSAQDEGRRQLSQTRGSCEVISFSALKMFSSFVLGLLTSLFGMFSRSNEHNETH